jgi:hypothetical protein
MTRSRARRVRRSIPPDHYQGSHPAAAESLLGEVREQSADLDTLIAQLVKRLAHPEPDSNVALVVGYHPTPSRSARRRCGCSPRRPRASCGAADGRVQHPEPSLGLHSLSVALFPMVIMTMTSNACRGWEER